MTTSQIDNLSKEIARLRENESRERQRQADILGRINRANDAASRTKNASTLKSKAREIENSYKDLAAVEKRLANLANQIADKSKRLHSYEERQARDAETERKKLVAKMDRRARKNAEEQKRLIREREAHEQRITREVSCSVLRYLGALCSILPGKNTMTSSFVMPAKTKKDSFAT